jgi:hypothetical protein
VRIAGLVALAAVLAAVAVLVLRDGGSRPTAPPGSVALVGDSLNVGIEPYLPGELSRWRIENHNQVGRVTEEGVDVLRREGGRLARRVVISLGTNDPAGDVEGFRADLRDALAAAGPRRCVVWLTIHREGHERFNDVLRREAAERPNLLLVDWAAMVRAHPEWLAADGVHATPGGYARRAEAVAQAVESCQAVRAEPA